MRDEHELKAYALVLLSGGLDSAAALVWAQQNFRDVRALAFDYGQPHRAELAASQAIAGAQGVPWSRFALADAVRGMVPIVPPEPGDVHGISRANLPARNMIFLSIAVRTFERAIGGAFQSAWSWSAPQIGRASS